MMEHPDPLDSGKLDWIWDGWLDEMYGYTDSDKATLARVLSSKCAQCGADIGVWCRTANGRELRGLDDQHLARRMS